MEDAIQLGRRQLLAGTAGAIGAVALPAVAAPSAAASAATSARPVVVTPEDIRYPDLVRGLNQRWVGSPEAVCLVRSTEQVVEAVQQAVRSGKRVSVRGGGHCFEDFVYNPAVQVVIDLSEFNGVYFDRPLNAFAVEAGANLLDLYETLYRLWGVTVPAGVCYDVGVGGHISGGGMGMLCRQYGLSVDHLYAVEVVVVDADGSARAVLATREKSDPNRDLWWAHTGGGGGNFGVVTRYLFRSPGATGTDPAKLLPTPPHEVLVSAVAWPWSELTEQRFSRLVQNYGDWHVANSAPDTPYAGLMALLSLTHRSNGQISMLVQHDGTRPDSEREVDEFLAAISRGVGVAYEPATSPVGEQGPMPDFATPRRLPWLQATRRIGTTDGSLNDPSLRIDYKSAYMRTSMPPRQIAAVYRHLSSTKIDNPTAMLQLHSYGGKVNAVGPADTASVHRDSVYKMIWIVQWVEQAEDRRYVHWLREFYRDMYADTGGVPVPNEVTDGCYVNYPDIDLNNPRINTSNVPWYKLYYKDNYPRLQRAKARWDPRDTFRHGQSVRLP